MICHIGIGQGIGERLKLIVKVIGERLTIVVMHDFLLTLLINALLGLQNPHQSPIYTYARWRERFSNDSNNIAGGDAQNDVHHDLEIR